MRLLHISLLIGTFGSVAACGSPDVKLGDGNQSQVSGGTGGTAGSAGSSGSGGAGGEPELCTTGVVGQSGVCAAYDALKAQASDLCATQNLALADVSFDGACDPGSAMFAKVTCCGEVPAPPPTPECIYDVAGEPGQCSPNGALEQQASDDCHAAGLELVDITYDNSCGPGASSFAKFACCFGGQPPPPPPAPCFGELLGEPLSCTDNEDLATKAWYLCDGAGATLTNLSYEDACSPDASHYAKVECCYPPPPPPPGECFGDHVGDPGSCTDNAVLEAQASAICESQNATLSDFFSDGGCGPTASNTAKFTCCGMTPPPPPPPPPVCADYGVSMSQCTSNLELAAAAKQVCAETNTEPEGLVFDGACGPTSSLSAKFVCCAPEPPSPPPGCWSAGIGAPGCTDNDNLKQMASNDCAAVGAGLAKIGYDNSCSPNSSTSAEYTCCSPTF